MDHHPAEVLVDASSLEEQDWGTLSRFASLSVVFTSCSAVRFHGSRIFEKAHHTGFLL